MLFSWWKIILIWFCKTFLNLFNFYVTNSMNFNAESPDFIYSPRLLKIGPFLTPPEKPCTKCNNRSDPTPRILTFCKTAVISRDFCRFRLDVVVAVMKHVCTQWYSAIEWTKQFKTCTHRLLKNRITFNILPNFLFCLYFR